jgi:SNF2 family DNA or RNA helicase
LRFLSKGSSEMKKTVLLIYPHLVQKNGLIWELLHISKEKNGIQHKTEPVTLVAARKYFPQFPEVFGNLLNKFSEKNIKAARQEMVDAAAKMGVDKKDSDWFNNAFVRQLYQDLVALKPFLQKLSCYHQAAVQGDKNRFRTAPCSFSSNTPGLRFQVRRATAGYLFVEPEVELNGNFFPLPDFTQHAFLLEQKNEYFLLRFTDYKTLCWIGELNWHEAGTDPGRFTEDIVARLESNYPVLRNGLLDGLQVNTAPVGRVLLSEISGQFLMFTPQFDYDGFLADSRFHEKAIVHSEGKEYVINRHKDAERAILAQIEMLHSNFSKQANGYYYLSFEEAQRKNWFLKAFRKLLELDIQVVGMDMLKHFRYCHEKPVTTVQVLKQEPDSIEINFSLFFGNEEISFPELQKVIRAGQQALALKDGSIALLEEEWLLKYAIIVKHARIGKEVITVPKWLAISLNADEQTAQPLGEVLKTDWWRQWQQWQSSDQPLYSVPAAVNAALRVYQQKGYEWLRLLNEIGAGMFLADDMGLGKTLQTICFVAHLLETNHLKKALIVCPASLLYNWQNELEKFAPSLVKLVYHGAGRNKQVFSDPATNIIITSYGTLRSEADSFLSHNFSVVVLDESHVIKNPDSQVAKVVHRLFADRRVTLSGTPIMNNTLDLYSQLQFILPDMFGSRAFFKREYADPIDRDKHEQRIRDLQKLVAPFVLRRTKEQVAKDLPAKTEMVLWCQMEDGQQAVYDAVRALIKGEIKASIAAQGLQKSKLQVLQGILKLRQVCNSPVLLKDDEYSCTDSVKLTELLEEIENNLSDHKALVFSQFTSMLDILAKELVKRNIPFLLLTGATPAKERDRMVQEFNSEVGSSRVFLLSLKAGNAGLNLTAADYVFLFDPWWNSAVEQQAIDRTHRIGQTKNVFAYKLICRNTIEERIMQLQEQKKELAGELIGEEEGFVKALMEEDLEFLLG